MAPRESQKSQVSFRSCLQYPPLLAVGIDLQLKNEIFSYCMTENEAKYLGVFKNINLKKNYMIKKERNFFVIKKLSLKPYQKKSYQFFKKPLRTSIENDVLEMKLKFQIDWISQLNNYFRKYNELNANVN